MDDDILKRYPRHDTDFIYFKDQFSKEWSEQMEAYSSAESVFVYLMIISLVAGVLFICSRTSTCPCYPCLQRFRRQPPRTDQRFLHRPPSDDRARTPVAREDEHHNMGGIIPSTPSAPPASADTRGGRGMSFDDPPPEYSEVVKSDLPPYCDPQCHTTDISINMGRNVP